MRLDEYDFSIRALNCLRTANLHTIEELRAFVDEYGVNGLLRYRNFGSKSIQEITEVLRDNEPKCCTGCKAFYGGEIRHHPHCPYYPDSFSEMYDNAKDKIDRLLAGYEQIANWNGALETVNDYARVIFETECRHSL